MAIRTQLARNLATAVLIFGTTFPAQAWNPAASPDAYTAPEDTLLSISAPGVLGNDSDSEGGVLNAHLVSTTIHGTLSWHGDGSFSYRPNTNYNGPDAFTYRASDGQTSSDPVTVTIMVTPVNDRPIARHDTDYTVLGDQALTIAAPGVLGNDSDPDGDELTTVLATAPAHGTVTLSANGQFVYQPAADYSGPDSFTYVANDKKTVSLRATVSLMVVPVNSPPTVSIVSPQNGAALLDPAAISVMAGASDPNGTVTNVQFLVNGAAVANVASAPFYFTTSNPAPGNYRFVAIATDNDGLSATSAPVSIEVITNTVVAVGPIVLNRQNGLFEQFVTVSNCTAETWASGVRLFVCGLDATNQVWNATGTNDGAPYLDQANSVSPAGTITFVVQYHVPDPRSVPTPALVATPMPFERPEDIPQITAIHPRSGGTMEVSFTSRSGRIYFVQCSDDLIHWKTEPVAITGTGAIITAAHGRTAGKCFYRVLRLP